MTSNHWVVIGSANGSGNAGDEAMWLSAVQQLRSIVGNDAAIVTDGPPRWNGGLAGITTLPYAFHSLMRAPKLYSSRAVALAVAGRILSRPRQLPFATRRYERSRVQPVGDLQKTWFDAVASANALIFSGAGAMTDRYAVHGVLSWALLAEWAEQAGTPVAYVGQGIGPFANRTLEEVAARGLRTARLIGTRDPKSRSWAESQTLPGQIVWTEDWAVLAEPSTADKARADALISDLLDGSPFLAVCIHRVHGMPRSAVARLTRMAEAVASRARRAGMKVLFVPNMVGGGPNDDRETARIVLSDSLRTGGAVVVESPERATVLRTLLGRSRGVITTRYHSAVFAGAEKRPLIGVAIDPYWRQKLEGAIAFAGVPGYVMSSDDEVADLERSVDLLLSGTLRPLERPSQRPDDAIETFQSFVQSVSP